MSPFLLGFILFCNKNNPHRVTFVYLGYSKEMKADQEIVNALREGQTKVFREVYAYYPMVQSYVLNNSGTEEDAKDLFQNALISLYKNVRKPDFKLTSKLSTYLYSICKNKWIKTLNRDRNRHSVGLDHAGYQSEETKSNEEDLSFEKRVLEYLQKLGNPCRSLILFHEYDQLPWEEIAENLGYSNAHTARQQKYKCLQRLRKMIPESLKLKYQQR